MKKGLEKLKYKDVEVLIRKSDGYFDATSLLKGYNDKTNGTKKIWDFSNFLGVKRKVAIIAERHSNPNIIESVKGAGGGTFMHPEMLMTFHNWLNGISDRKYSSKELKFYLDIKEAFRGIIKFEEKVKFDLYTVDLYSSDFKLAIQYRDSYYNCQKVKKMERIMKDYLDSEHSIDWIIHKEGESIMSTVNLIIKYVYKN